MRLTTAVGVSLMLLLSACGSDEESLDTAETTAPSTQSTTTAAGAGGEGSADGELTADTPIGPDGIGPLKAGMTLAEVREAAAPRELILDGFEDFDGYCWYARVKGLEEDFSLLFLAPERDEPVTDPEEGVLGRASTEGDLDESPARTAEDVGVGSTKPEIEAAYAGQVEVSPHKYTEGGQYLDTGKGADRHLLRFETGPEDKVTAIHGGLTDAVELGEGCA